MAWSITERFPSWGETGEFPSAGFFYEGGDQVNEKHLDALWNGINGLEEDVQAALNDIDSNADGVVDKADAGAAGFSLDGDLVAAGAEVIWDESAGYIPQGRLQNDSITATAGDGLKGGGSTALGASFTLDIEPNDFAGHGLEDDGSDNLRLDAANIGVGINGGDGIDLSLDESVIKDGGAKEIDAQEFSGGDGTSGQVLTTDGNDAFWQSVGTSVEDKGVQVESAATTLDFIGLDADAEGGGEVSVSGRKNLAVGTKISARTR